MQTWMMSLTAAGPGLGAAAAVFVALLIGHVLADYPLQGAFLSVAKNRHADVTALFHGKQPPRGLWIHALTAHSLVHAGAVWIVTGSLALGMAEWVLHWVIDFAKCEKWTNYTADQFLHIACKVVFAGLVGFGVV
jgi:hypothetical protein